MTASLMLGRTMVFWYRPLIGSSLPAPFNGVSVGETGINAALCGQWGCPVLLVTGDDAVCREATELLGEGRTWKVAGFSTSIMVYKDAP